MMFTGIKKPAHGRRFFSDKADRSEQAFDLTFSIDRDAFCGRDFWQSWHNHDVAAYRYYKLGTGG